MKVHLFEQLRVFQVVFFREVHHVAVHLDQSARIRCIDVKHLIAVHFHVEVVLAFGGALGNKAGGHQQIVLEEPHGVGKFSTWKLHSDLFA